MKEKLIISTTELCKLWQRTPATISEYVKNGMPKLARGRFHLNEIWQWRYSVLKEKSETGSGDIKQERLRKIEVERKLLEIELAKQQGKLVSLDEIKVVWERVIVAFKNKLLLFPNKVSSRLLNMQTIGEIKSLLDEEIFQILNELSQSRVEKDS
ncbi:MAG: hypothetical protein Q8K98_00870 [Bacteroidota bacterium]|nr:hypothetical protein [Bacteroidota bacterium]